MCVSIFQQIILSYTFKKESFQTYTSRTVGGQKLIVQGWLAAR